MTDELRYPATREPLDPLTEVVVARVCLQCQAVQMASPENLGRMIQLANELYDRELNRRLKAELALAECAEERDRLRADLARVNARLAVAKGEHRDDRTRRRSAPRRREGGGALMGYICHNAVLVTGWNDDIERVHAHALALLTAQDGMGGVPLTVLSPLSQAAVNGYRSFAIFPDGSKEGWGTSDDSDAFRSAVIDFIEDHDFFLAWCEVRFGDEYDMNGMVRCSGEPPMLLDPPPNGRNPTPPTPAPKDQEDPK